MGWPVSLPYIQKIHVSMAISTQSASQKGSYSNNIGMKDRGHDSLADVDTSTWKTFQHKPYIVPEVFQHKNPETADTLSYGTGVYTCSVYTFMRTH